MSYEGRADTAETAEGTENKTLVEIASEMADKMFDAWEKRTSEYAETIFANPALLNATGLLLSISHRNKIMAHKALAAVWKNLNLPNKDDQERTLHLLGELQTRLLELEEKLASSKAPAQGKDTTQSTSAPSSVNQPHEVPVVIRGQAAPIKKAKDDLQRLNI